MFEKVKETIERVAPIETGLWEDIRRRGKVIPVQKNEILIRYGSKCRETYYIVEGSFVKSQISESGVSKAVWFHFDDYFEFLATADSFFADEHTKYEIKALEDSVVIKFSKQMIDEWVEAYTCFNQFYRHYIIQDFITIFEARSCLLTYSSVEFLQYCQKRFPFLFLKLPGHYIADFIGVTPEWYSKLQRKV